MKQIFTWSHFHYFFVPWYWPFFAQAVLREGFKNHSRLFEIYAYFLEKSRPSSLWYGQYCEIWLKLWNKKNEYWKKEWIPKRLITVHGLYKMPLCLQFPVIGCFSAFLQKKQNIATGKTSPSLLFDCFNCFNFYH